MSKQATPRSFAPLTDEHLARLSQLANDDHQYFTREGGRPEYRGRRLAVVLAQGAAMHFVYGETGIKDLDIWTFYAAIPGVAFRFGQRKRHADFGPSEHGRNAYPPGSDHPQLNRWRRFSGRRVDLMIRSLHLAPAAPPELIIEALRDGLSKGAMLRRRTCDDEMPSNWWLAQKAVVMINPFGERGRVVWLLS